MVAGKVLGGSIIAMIQGMLFLLAALFLDVDWTIVQVVSLVAILFIASMMMTCGILICWKDGINSGVSCHYESRADADVVVVRAFFPVPNLGTGQLMQDVLHWIRR